MSTRWSLPPARPCACAVLVRSYPGAAVRYASKVVIFGSGYRGPNVLVPLSICTVALVALVYALRHPPLDTLAVLFLSLEGTALLASAFTPQGGVPPPEGFRKRLRWFLSAEFATPVNFYQPAFFGGLLFLYVAAVLSAL